MATRAKKTQPVLAVERGPFQLAWEAMRWLMAGNGYFTVAGVMEKSSVKRKTVRSLIEGLERSGHVGRRAERPNGAAALEYVLLRDNGVEVPRVNRQGEPVRRGLVQEQIWRTLSVMPGDTNQLELAAHASTPQVPVTPKAAESYLRWLVKAGYVQMTKPGYGGSHPKLARYRMCRRSGPKPPVILEFRSVYDPNTGEVVYADPTNVEEAVDVS